MPIKQSAPPIIKKLAKLYPNARYYLNFSTPLELLAATILSAQVRDEIVNAATPALFSRYKSARDYARASQQELEALISRIPFYRNKAKNIKEACRILEEKYKGQVPKTIEELILLPGIGRKTANVILSNAFDIVEGIVVDTHVIRLSRRMGLTREKDPVKIERNLMTAVPRRWWKQLAWWMKEHGRAVCRAPKPLCDQCKLADLCPKIGV